MHPNGMKVVGAELTRRPVPHIELTDAMPLDQLLSKFAGGSGGTSSLASLFSAPGTQGVLGGAASGAAVSLLMNKKARKKLGKTAAKVGGAAAIAGVGYLAYRTWQNRNDGGAQAAPPPPPVPASLEMASEEAPVAELLQVKMILAMIAAASADGTIDGQEMDGLLCAIENAPIDPAGKSQLTAALNEPPSVEEIAGLVSGPEEASELYGAALTAIEVDTPAEHLFLRRFSNALRLDPELVKTLHQTMAA